MRVHRFRIPAILLLMLSLAPCAPAVDAIARARADLQLGFTVSGRVQAVEVQPGDEVSAGDVLIRLDTRAAEAVVRLNQLKAESDLGERIAEAELSLAEGREERVREAHERDAADAFELEEAVMETTRRRLQVELARRAHLEAQQQLKLAQLSLENYTLTAPMDGIIEDVLVDPGELVDDLQGVVRLIALDPLVIDVEVPLAQSRGLAPGDAAVARFTQLSGEASVTGRITQLSSVVTAGTEKRRVRIEAPNPGRVPSGSLVDVGFSIAQGRATSSSLPLVGAVLVAATVLVAVSPGRRRGC